MKSAARRKVSSQPFVIPVKSVYGLLLYVAQTRGLAKAEARKNIKDFMSRKNVDALDYIMLGLEDELATAENGR